MLRPYLARGVRISTTAALLFGDETTREPRGVVAPCCISSLVFLSPLPAASSPWSAAGLSGLTGLSPLSALGLELGLGLGLGEGSSTSQSSGMGTGVQGSTWA